MQVVCISDTHNQHKDLHLPPGDILIHAGDFTEAGSKQETIAFLDWFSSQNYRWKIFIAGNHDFYLEKLSAAEKEDLIPEDVIYLEDSGFTIKGCKFWGSPVTPGDGTWAFNRERGDDIKSHWDLVPQDTQVLITHTPPFGIKDQLDNKRQIGCEELSKKLEIIKPKFHVFGHIHNTYGLTHRNPTSYLNASCLDNKYRLLHPPQIIAV